MGRFVDADRKISVKVNKLLKGEFYSYSDAKIKCVYDTKPMKSKGKYVYARIKLTDDLIRHLTADESTAFEGYDFILIMDKLLMENLDSRDQKRIIFHELNHIGKNDNDKFCVVPHDFEGFYSELDYNRDDPNWNERFSYLYYDLHFKEKEE